MIEQIKSYYEREMAIIRSLNFDEIEVAVKAIEDAYKNGATIYTFGNGGSASTASHFVCDFNKGICEKLEEKYNLICLNDNMSIITAIANDISYDEIFHFQLTNKLKDIDLIIAISGSGNSENVIRAVKYAKSIGCKVIGMTGYSGGKLRELADYHMHVPIDDMQITEDIHMSLEHMMYCVLKERLKLKAEMLREERNY